MTFEVNDELSKRQSSKQHCQVSYKYYVTNMARAFMSSATNITMV